MDINTLKNEDEVVAKANDAEYGLYAAVYTKDITGALHMVKRLDSGSIGVNCTSPYWCPRYTFQRVLSGRYWLRGLDY